MGYKEAKKTKMNWIIISVIVVLVIMFIKAKAFRHKFFMITFLVVLLFIYITYSKVAAANSISINSLGDFFKAGKIYFSWLGNAVFNLKSLTSNAVKMNWNITNKTASSNIIENED